MVHVFELSLTYIGIPSETSVDVDPTNQCTDAKPMLKGSSNSASMK